MKDKLFSALALNYFSSAMILIALLCGCKKTVLKTKFPEKTESYTNSDVQVSSSAIDKIWTSIGGDIGGKLAVIRHTDGHLEIFARTNNSLWHKSQTSSSTWSEWASFNGVTPDESILIQSPTIEISDLKQIISSKP